MRRKILEDYEALVRTMLLLLMLVTVCFIIRVGGGGKKLVSSDEVATARSAVRCDWCGTTAVDCGGKAIRMTTANPLIELNMSFMN